jgi:CubicO group peptidase (beta-lactamase class C family)
MRLRALTLLAVLALCLGAPGAARAGDADLFADVLDARMPELLETYGVPGAVVAYIDNGAVAWTHAYGLADLKTGAPMRPEMVFNHGSDGKVLTAWGLMRLVELGLVELDAPANRYLKRWQIQSDAYDPDGVTLRRLLSHTAGLTVPGFNDYGPRRTLPSLVDMLEGRNQLDGAVVIGWKPGTRSEYSGGGFVILQMVIEDVTGEPFAGFMQREVIGPLGLTSLRWAWTPDLIAQAPTPHGLLDEPLAYRQLAGQAVGSEISTVADFARFVAAAVEGPAGEPAGRGVLQPETVRQMAAAQPATNGTAGLGYGLGNTAGGQLLMHFGSNPGWNAHFVIHTGQRQGFVIANNGMRGHPLNLAVHLLWLKTVFGVSGGPAPQPASTSYGVTETILGGLAALLAVPLLFAAVWVGWGAVTGRRRWAWPRSLRRLWPALPWVLLALTWWYWYYTPWPLPLPAIVPDLWRRPTIGYVMGALAAWLVFSLVVACLPATSAARAARPRRPAIPLPVQPEVKHG